ncbi:MAG: hypothetical protein WCC14_02970 [Acidobacteriaceae bacterium]
MTVLGTLVCIFLIFFGLHTEIALAPGNKLLLPFVVSFAGAVGVLLLNVKRIKFSVVSLFGALSLILVIFAVITAQGDGNLPQHIISTGQLLYSLVIAYGTFLGIQVLGMRRASRFFLIAAIVLIVGSFLELYGGLRPASDAFRAAVNSWQPTSLYNSDLRDIQNYGGIRPKFFTREPSILGAMVGYAILFWFLSARRFTGFRVLGAAVLTVPAFLLVRSPEILVCFFLTFLFFLLEIGRVGTSRMRATSLSVSVLVAMLVAPGLVASNANYGQTGSFFYREVAPPLVAAAVLRSQPFFGTGIGGWAQVVPYGETVMNKAPGSVYRNLQHVEMTDPDVAKDILHSAAWEFWSDLGILGGIVVLWVLARALRELEIPRRFFIFSCGALIFTMSGALNEPRQWVCLFTMACLYQMHTAALSEGREPAVSEAQSNEVIPEYYRWAV